MSSPIIKINKVNEDGLTFTISNINVSIANGIRRTILTDIPVIGFDKEQCVIEVNTSQFINEIVKHRLTCIPVMLEHYAEEKLEDILPERYTMEVDVDNTEKEECLVTTGDFVLVNKETGAKVSKNELLKIFPKNHITGDHITFLRLRPKLSENIPGQALRLRCGFGVFTARDDPVYNAVSKCTYMNTVDEKEAKTAWENKKIEVMKKLEEDGETKADIEEQVEFEKKNFDALNKYRYFKEDSFDFTVRSVSFYSEQQVVLKACSVLIEKLENFVQNILKIDVETGAENDEPPAVTIMLSKDVPNFPSTVVNSYDIIMKNEDYTLGNILQHMVYQMFYMGEKTVIFCGFQKFHPHATESVLRVAYVKPITNDVLVDDLKKSALKGVEIIRKIQKGFGK